MIADLGLEDRIIGIGRYDPVAPEGAEVMGSLLNVDYEKLLAAEPTHVLLQPERKKGVPQKLESLASRHGWTLAAFHIDTLADVRRVLWDPDRPERSLGGLLGKQQAARALSRSIRRRLDRLAKLTADREPVRTMLVFRPDPVGAVGRGTFLHEVLNDAGGKNVVQGRHYQSVGREKILAMQPEAVILLVSPGEMEPARIEKFREAMGALRIPAAQAEGGTIGVLADPVAELPSSSVPRVAAKLAKLLHPQLSSQIEQRVERDAG